jgi:hypothetical protein
MTAALNDDEARHVHEDLVDLLPPLAVAESHLDQQDGVRLALQTFVLANQNVGIPAESKIGGAAARASSMQLLVVRHCHSILSQGLSHPCRKQGRQSPLHGDAPDRTGGFNPLLHRFLEKVVVRWRRLLSFRGER